MPINYVDKAGLSAIWSRISELFQRREHKTGSDSEYKVLSDNNLTDDLLQKINDAGVSSFTGNYSDLYGKPSIEGHEVASGNQTAASLGLATPADISTATTGMATQTWVQQQQYQTAQNVTDAVSSATQGMATQSWVSSQGFQNSAAVQSAISTATTGMATQTWVEGQDYATTAEVTSAVSAAVSSAYTAKGSVAFASLPELTSAKVGDVYNVTDAFTTTENFIEGASKSYPAGTNVVCVNDGDAKKWDVLAGMVDLSGYVKSTDLVAITTEEINQIFSGE